MSAFAAYSSDQGHEGADGKETGKAFEPLPFVATTFVDDSSSGQTSGSEDQEHDAATTPGNSFGGDSLHRSTNDQQLQDVSAEPSKKHKRKKHHKRKHNGDKAEGSIMAKAVKSMSQRVLTEESALWYLDIEGDPGNLRYESVYKKDLPTYRRLGRGNVIGLNHKVYFDDGRGGAKPKFSIGPRIHDPAFIASICDKSVKIIRQPAPPNQALDGTIIKTRRFDSLQRQAAERAYIPLENVGSSKASLTQTSDTFVDLSSVSSSIGEKHQSGLEDDDEEQGEDKEQYIKRRTAEFNQQLRADSSDVSLWLRYISFQDEAFETSQVKTHKSIALLVERKLALFEKALSKLPDHEDLLVAYLALCEEKMTPEELEAKWQRTMFSHPEKPQLWRAYLTHSTANLAQFTVPKTQAKFHKCIETMVAMKSGSFLSHKLDARSAEENLLDVFVHSCDFQARSGYFERAFACYQAFFEYNFHLPKTVVKSAQRGKQAAFFETFWESQAPRFGDEGATGFNSWLGARKTNKPVPALTLAHPNDVPPPAPPADVATTWQKWHLVESFREKEHWQSWRPLPQQETEEDCEDPDRVALFDDISGHLICFTKHDIAEQVVLECVKFLGGNVQALYSTNHHRTQQEFSRLTHAGALFYTMASHMSMLKRARDRTLEEWRASGLGSLLPTLGPPEHLTRSTTQAPYFSRVSGMAIGDSVDVWGDLLPGSGELDPEAIVTGGRYGWCPKHSADLHADKRAAINRIFEQAIQAAPSSTLLRTAYIDHLYASKERKKAKKLAKKMLKEKENRNNLQLYLRFGELEYELGNVDGAIKVYTMALQLSASDSRHEGTPMHTPMIASICRAYADTMFRRGIDTHKEQILNLLGNYLCDSLQNMFTELTPTQQAKARRNMEKAVTNQVFVQYDIVPDMASHVCCCLYYKFLLDGLAEFQECMKAFLGWIASCDNDFRDTIEHERICASYFNLIELHISQSKDQLIPPAVLRSTLEQCMQYFPHNPEFLTAFCVLEARHRVAGRVHRLFAQLTHSESSAEGSTAPCVVWLLAIAAEICSLSGGSANRVSELLRLATSSRQGKHCVLLWRMYMEYSRLQAGLDGPRLSQQLFYQAIESCPGAKILYMDTVRLNPRNMQETLDILEEKELHLRTPVEELDLIFDDLPLTSEAMDDIEYVPREHPSKVAQRSTTSLAQGVTLKQSVMSLADADGGNMDDEEGL
eukprot:m.177918 g.177918  ORF g.177918 m.177918 type:complete len:1216 (-) comp14637_c0_seq5:3731-7378(-)